MNDAWNVYYKTPEMTRYIPEFRSNGPFDKMFGKFIARLKHQRENPQSYQYEWILKNSETGEVIPGELIHD